MVEVEQIETGIFVYRWIDNVTMEDAQRASQKLLQMNGKQPFVALVDMVNMKNLPRDFGTMRALIKQENTYGLRGYVIYGAPQFVKTMVRTLAVIAPTQYLFASTQGEALQKARELRQVSR